VGKDSNKEKKKPFVGNQDQFYPIRELIYARIIGNRCIHRVVVGRKKKKGDELN
jgi:hypothetical protein